MTTEELIQKAEQANDVQSSFRSIVLKLQELIDSVWIYVVIAFSSVVAVWGAYIGIRVTVAKKNEEKINARGMVKQLAVGIIVMFVLAMGTPLVIRHGVLGQYLRFAFADDNQNAHRRSERIRERNVLNFYDRGRRNGNPGRAGVVCKTVRTSGRYARGRKFPALGVLRFAHGRCGNVRVGAQDYSRRRRNRENDSRSQKRKRRGRQFG